MEYSRAVFESLRGGALTYNEAWHHVYIKPERLAQIFVVKI